jgi:ParB-like chromosome segregation protein Spo0J
MVATQEIRMPIPIDDIEICDDRREVDRDVVDRLAASIEKMGLQYEITVLKKNGEGRYRLVAGRHRIEAMRLLGRPGILAHIVDMTMEEARLWEISENLHRAELSTLQRDEQVAEWIAITEKSYALQKATHRKAGQQAGGVNAASRELGIDKYDAHRAVKVASLSPEAKKAARETGLDDNRKALLEAARAPAEQQAAIIVDFAARKSARPVAKVNAHEKAKAAWRVAAMCAEDIPREKWSWTLSLLLLAGADNIAEAFAAVTDLPVGDYPLKEHLHALSEQSHAA